MGSVPYDIQQGQSMTMANPMEIAAIGGDNPTPFYLNFPQLPPGLQWVFPYTYNFMYPVDPPMQVRVDASKIPAGYPPAPVSTLQAILTAYTDAHPFSAGIRGAPSGNAAGPAISSGKLVNTGDSITIPIVGGGTANVAFKGINNIGGTAIGIQGSLDGVNFYNVPLFGLDHTTGQLTDLTVSTLQIQYDGLYWVLVSGLQLLKISLGATSSGIIIVTTFQDSSAIALIGKGQQTGFFSSSVVLASDTAPFKWQAPGVSDAGQGGFTPLGLNNFGVTAATDTNLLAALGTGKAYYLHFCSFTLSAAAVFLLYDGPSIQNRLLFASIAGTGPFNMDFKGQRLGNNNPLLVRTSANIGISGTVTYSGGT